MEQIRLFLADDHRLVREGFAHLASEYPNIKIVGEASDGVTALESIELLTPDIAILDISMPGLSGIEVIKKLRDKKILTKCLVISMHDTDDFLYMCYKAGAWGHLSKECSKSELFGALYEILHGRLTFGTKTSDELAVLIRTYEQKIKTDEIDYENIIITSREKIIIEKLIEGKSTKEMAEELYISENTVTTHRRNILHKFNCVSSFELVSLFNSNYILNQRLLKKTTA